MILMLSFCGCTNVGSNRNEYMSNWFKSEQEISDNMMKQIIDLYNEGNVKEFEKLFSQNSKKDIEDINKQISSFFEFIDGDIQEYSGDCASSSENNNGNKRIELDGMYHISTSKNEYYLNALDRSDAYYFQIESFNSNGISPRTPVIRVE